MGSALKFEGHIASFRNDKDNNPCYRCLYPELPDVVDACVDSCAWKFNGSRRLSCCYRVYQASL